MASDPTRELLEALVARASVTPDDAGCCDLLAQRLGALGFDNEFLDAGGVRNLWARRGSDGPLLVFAGHTDVVPPGPAEHWASDPFTPTERDGLLYGRGTADMKSGIAAMVTAVQRYLDNGGTGSIAFLITSDEEGPAEHGTRHVVDVLRQRGVRPDYAVVGEASGVEQLGDRIMIGRRGSLHLNLTVRGRQGHVAYPERVDNPIHRLGAAVAELAATHWDEGDTDFPPTSFQTSNIRAGTGADNVVPGSAEAVCNFRHAPASPADSLRDRTETIVRKHSPDFEAQWRVSGAPFVTQRGALIDAARAAINTVTGLDPTLSTAGGTSDARFIAPLGTEVVEIGPVGASIHQIDEHVRIADLNRLATIYQHLMERLLPL